MNPYKFEIKERCTGKTCKSVLDMVDRILENDLEYSRVMQEKAKYQEERLAWQTRIMHTIDLRDQIRMLYIPEDK